MRKSEAVDANTVEESVVKFKIAQATEAAARACYPHIGNGDRNAADQAAVDALRTALNTMAIRGRIVIGEGERDNAPMLHPGEIVGTGHHTAVDIAVDPLEGTTPCVHGMPGSLSVIALARQNTLLHAPDIYMEKIAVGPGLPKDVVSLNRTPKENMQAVAQARGIPLSQLTVSVLRRPRHHNIVSAARQLGSKVLYIDDGDVAGVVATGICGEKYRDFPKRGRCIHMYMGTGGAPEGVIAASALRCLGGQMYARLVPKNAQERQKCHGCGIEDVDKIYALEDLVKGEVIFCATGITDSQLAEGIQKIGMDTYRTHTILMDSRTTLVQSLYSTFSIKTVS